VGRHFGTARGRGGAPTTRELTKAKRHAAHESQGESRVPRACGDAGGGKRGGGIQAGSGEHGRAELEKEKEGRG
jgi:hypothetical protein